MIDTNPPSFLGGVDMFVSHVHPSIFLGANFVISVIPVCLKAPEIKGNTKGNEHGESLCYVRNRFGFVTAMLLQIFFYFH